MARNIPAGAPHAQAGGALLILALATLALSGCAQTKSWIDKVRGPSSYGSSSAANVDGAPTAADYLDELGLLASNDPAAQAEIFADARAAATLTPSPSSKLRFGLVLATPGHPESNAAEAQTLLRDALARSELMTGYEVALANIYLANVEHRLVLESETRRLRSVASRTQRAELAALRTQLANAQAEIATLEQQLTEATDKLEAITSIERSIREQEKD